MSRVALGPGGVCTVPPPSAVERRGAAVAGTARWEAGPVGFLLVDRAQLRVSDGGFTVAAHAHAHAHAHRGAGTADAPVRVPGSRLRRTRSTGPDPFVQVDGVPVVEPHLSADRFHDDEPAAVDRSP